MIRRGFKSTFLKIEFLLFENYSMMFVYIFKTPQPAEVCFLAILDTRALVLWYRRMWSWLIYFFLNMLLRIRVKKNVRSMTFSNEEVPRGSQSPEIPFTLSWANNQPFVPLGRRCQQGCFTRTGVRPWRAKGAKFHWATLPRTRSYVLLAVHVTRKWTIWTG